MSRTFVLVDQDGEPYGTGDNMHPSEFNSSCPSAAAKKAILRLWKDDPTDDTITVFLWDKSNKRMTRPYSGYVHELTEDEHNDYTRSRGMNYKVILIKASDMDMNMY